MRHVLMVACAVAAIGCGDLTGPYGNGCPAPDPNYHYCGLCPKTNLCHYCGDVNGQNTCADACTCGSASGGGSGGGTTGGGGTSGGGTSGGSSGGCNGTCPASCPADAQYECSGWVAEGTCSGVQSCTCYGNSPTAYCGIFYRTSDGSFFWCGGGYNMACSSIGVYACAQQVANYCQ